MGSIEINGYVRTALALSKHSGSDLSRRRDRHRYQSYGSTGVRKPVFASSFCIQDYLRVGKCVFALTEKSISRFLGDARLIEQASRAAYDYVDGPFIRESWSSLLIVAGSR